MRANTIGVGVVLSDETKDHQHYNTIEQCPDVIHQGIDQREVHQVGMNPS